MKNIFNIFKKKESKQSQSAGTLFKNISSIVLPYKRLAWFPKTVEKNSSQLSSKFSGIPALSKDESWPCCANCEEPMQLFLQLNSKDLPESEQNLFGEGLLQVFYCTNWDEECEVKCDAFFPFSKSSLVRVSNYNAEEIYFLDKSPVKNAFTEKAIIGWISMEDYPNWEELSNFGINLTDEQSDLLCDLDYPKPKDKLWGWPYWVQGVEYPDCPECGESMKLLFQIDSEDNLPYMFGDSGCSHITQCEHHPDILTIAWACY